MHLSEDYGTWVIRIISTSTFQQTAPLILLLLLPTLAFFAASSITRRNGVLLPFAYTAVMSVTAHARSWLPWPFSSSVSTASSGHSSTKHERDRKKIKKHHIRTRSGQLQANGSAKAHESINAEPDEGYYPGLVNISGTYCFMNSTLQALASLSYLQPHINAIHAKAEVLDVPTPVVDSLKELLNELNTPHSSYRAFRPHEIIEVLTTQTRGRPNSLFNSREHQDAQELFQVVSECIKTETAAVDKEGARDRGFGAFAQTLEATKEIGKSVFDGLTANRRSCVICGYTEAVMHFAFDSWQLSVPRLAATCRLEDCLEDYTRIEILKDCICRKCSVVATQTRLQHELESLQEATKPEAKPSNSKKRRLKEVRKMEARVKEALQQGRIEDDLKDIRIEKVFSTASTKQAMIARPPLVLALHLNRSIHYGQYAAKNNCRVVFSEVLDLTPYTTSGNISTIPTAAISTPPPAVPRSTTPTPSVYGTPRTIYRLSAVVCHYGSHSFGHYICYRRKPRHPNVGHDRRFVPPKLVDPMTVSTENGPPSAAASVLDEGSGASFGPEYLWEDGEPAPGTGWLRISDDSACECGVEAVLAEGTGVFMLYYELALRDVQGVYPELAAMRASEETLKPEMRTVDLNGSVGSLVSEVGVGIQIPSQSGSSKNGKGRESVGMSMSTSGSVGLGTSQQLFEPRIVRSVAAGRGRSTSVQAASSSGKRGSSVGSATANSLPSEAGKTMKAMMSNGSALSRMQVSEPDLPKRLSASVPTLHKAESKPARKVLSKPPDLSSPAEVPLAPALAPSLPPKTPLSAVRPVLAPHPVHPPSPVAIDNLKA